MLNSDSKSEIEGVRWILIRRSVVGILFMAIVTLGTIRYATYVSHERQRELDRKKKEQEELRRDGGKSDRTSAPDAAAILAANWFGHFLFFFAFTYIYIYPWEERYGWGLRDGSFWASRGEGYIGWVLWLRYELKIDTKILREMEKELRKIWVYI